MRINCSSKTTSNHVVDRTLYLELPVANNERGMPNTTNNIEERNKPLIERVGDTLSLLTPCVYYI